MLAQIATTATRAGWPLLLGLAVGAAGWVYSGAFAPLVGDTEIDFLFFSPPLAVFLAWWLGASAVIALAHAAARRVVPGLPRAWLSPLWLLALPLVPVLLLPTPLHLYAGGWTYLFIDSRWTFVAVVAALVLYRLLHDGAWWSHRRTSLGMINRAPSPRQRLALDVLLAAVLVGVSALASPPSRFTSMVVGDEPKYIRYMENWYQGRGMDIMHLPAVQNLPPGDTPDLLGNIRRMGAALRVMPGDLAADIGALFGSNEPGPRPRPATEEGWFVDGKRGGVYQVHNPGLSLLLFPGYVIDRLFLNSNGSSGLFAEHLYATNTLLLVIYLLWGVALQRLLHAFTGAAILSTVLAAVAMISLPSSAFAYQYYPEAAGGLLITALARFALLSTGQRPGSMVWYGLLAGYLPWLHVRFLLVSLILAGAVLLTCRRSLASITWLVGGMAGPMLALALYYYHVAGNPMPWALYGLTQDVPPFTFSKLRHLPILWLDRPWGLVGHAPIYLLAPAGASLAWRRNKFAVAGATLVVFALAAPAAAHGLTGGGTTPLRLVAAVVPLLMLPVASAVMAARSHWTRAIIALLAVLTLQNGWMFNANMDRTAPWLQGPTVSGWLTTLLMPHYELTETRYAVWVGVWAVATLLLLVIPAVLATRSASAQTPNRRVGAVGVTAATLVGCGVLASAVSAATGQLFHPRFMSDRRDALERLAAFHVHNDRGGVRWSAQARGQIDAGRILDNADDVTVTLQPDTIHLGAGQQAVLTLNARGADGRPGWGWAVVNFDDEGRGERVPLFGQTRLVHVYRRAGEYTVRVAADIPGKGVVSARARVIVGRP